MNAYLLVCAVAMLLFYPFDVDSVSDAFVVLLSCSLENRSLSFLYPLCTLPIYSLFVGSIIFRWFIQTSGALATLIVLSNVVPQF